MNELEYLIHWANDRQHEKHQDCKFCLNTNIFEKSPFESDNGSYVVKTQDGTVIGSLQFEMKVFKEHGMYIHILSNDEIEFLKLRLS
jgi:hypothetical protein